MIEQYTSPVAVNNSQEPWLVGEGVVVSGGVAIPSLDFDFITGGLPGTVTFTRGSNATQFDSSGNLVYAPANLLTWSEDFGNAAWSKFQATVSANAVVAPDNTTTGDKLITNSGVAGNLFRATTLVAISYTQTIYAKAGEWSWLLLGATVAANTGVWFDLTNGIVGTQNSGYIGAITPVGNGWYRCAVTFTATAASWNVIIFATNANGSLSNGDGTSGVYIWGAQLNPTPMLGGVTASLSTYYPTTTTAYYGPRLDYNPTTLAARGLLIEEQRTNSIRNNTMVGAVAGTPGTLPTNWSVSGLGTLTRQVVGTGTVNGIAYIDLRFSGTTSTTQLSVRLEPNGTGGIPAANGQTWAASQWSAVIAGSLSNITSSGTNANLWDAAGIFVGGALSIPINTTATLTRLSGAGTITTVNTAFIQPQIFLTFSSGVAIDITLRIGLPQLEQGAFATSVIPTTTTALTRSADVANVNTLAPWYNATEGTLFVQAQDMSDAAHATSQPRAVSLNDTTTNNTIDISRIPASAQGRARIDVAAANQFNSLTTAWPLATQAKVALAYKANDYAACLGGGTVFTNTASSLIPTVTALSIGDIRTTVSNHWVGWIQRVAYYPRRLSNAELQAITA